ncbi:MAG TPA: hypothetical protein H9929_00205 [Candidatus Alistipes excrementavium]|nr:hypothetical protein [Candidatus Alistipes excrementavium]
MKTRSFFSGLFLSVTLGCAVLSVSCEKSEPAEPEYTVLEGLKGITEQQLHGAHFRVYQSNSSISMLFYFPFQTPLVSVFDQSTATVHFVSDKRFDVWEDIYSTEYPPADLSLSSSAKLHFHLFAIPDLGLEMECTEIMLPVPEGGDYEFYLTIEKEGVFYRTPTYRLGVMFVNSSYVTGITNLY